jgi:thiamine biosynthesis lipoprotein
MEPIIVNRKCMGSSFSIQAYPDGKNQTRAMIGAAIALAYAEIARVEDLLSDFCESPFNDINKYAGIMPVKVSGEILSLIDFSREIAQDTNGAFDITYASIGLLWREAFKSGRPPVVEDIAMAKALIGCDRIEINHERSEVFLPVRGMRLGLGSIGKSYGVDMAFSVLKQLGIKNYLVNGAGDLRVASAPDAPRAWKIGITNPFRKDKAPCGLIQVSKGAVATSGDYERYLSHDGKRYHHIIDARTGEIRNDVSSVTVLAPTTTIANAYATAVMALGLQEGTKFLSGKINARGVIITPEGKTVKCNF